MYTIPVPRHGPFVWHQLSNFINSVHCFQNRVSFRKITCDFELLRVYRNRNGTEKPSWKSKTNRGQTGRELCSQSQRKSFYLEFVWRRHKRPHRITKLIVMLYASRNAQSSNLTHGMCKSMPFDMSPKVTTQPKKTWKLYTTNKRTLLGRKQESRNTLKNPYILQM